MSWTEERTNLAVTLWNDGLSASQIAKRLGGVSRNAVIGKVHRLGLSARAAPSRPAAKALKTVKATKPPKHDHANALYFGSGKRQAPKAAEPIIERWERAGGATILTLANHMCKWPIGDPSSAAFTFCGGRRETGPYCHQHAQVAYTSDGNPLGKKAASTKELIRSLRRYMS